MQTAACLMPTSVGVAPGTTTLLLSGPTAPPVDCNPDKTAWQRYILNPPGKNGRLVDGVMQTGRRVCNMVAVTTLNGLGRVFGRRSPLGYIVQPPQYVAATKSRGTCESRPGRGPNYREAQTAMYEPDGQLGAVPTDFQLSSQYGYTPVVSQWIPFRQGTWSPAPWVPPTGAPASAPLDQGYWGKPLAGPIGDVVTPPAVDPATAAVDELRRHQDRMYMLGIISAGAVASTALVNVFRYAAEKRDTRRRKTAVAAEPAPAISGVRRRRRRR